jgi:hypothetical protein
MNIYFELLFSLGMLLKVSEYAMLKKNIIFQGNLKKTSVSTKKKRQKLLHWAP